MTMTHIAFPYRVDGGGRSAEVDAETHIRQLIEQLLFTMPGERVNRPDFGTDLLKIVFGPNSPELASATKATVQGALQQWLGDHIVVEAVNVESIDSTLRVDVRYLIRRTQQRVVTNFSREV
jgi:phage baseplate assembly protein W